MALSNRLVMRQGQSLVMTPQLLQAIKLLQFSSFELSAFVEAELERNPLLERADESEAPFQAPAVEALAQPVEGDWASTDIEIDAGRLADNLGTGADNAFETDAAPVAAEKYESFEGSGLSAQSWNGTAAGGDGEAANLEAYIAAQISLGEHLSAQLAVAVADPVDRLIGQMIVDSIDEAGYLADGIAGIAARLGVTQQRVEQILSVVQGFDPTGVGARTLAECIELQLRDRDRFDPAMQALVANLPLVAKRDFSSYKCLFKNIYCLV